MTRLNSTTHSVNAKNAMCMFQKNKDFPLVQQYEKCIMYNVLCISAFFPLSVKLERRNEQSKSFMRISTMIQLSQGENFHFKIYFAKNGMILQK